MLSQTIYYQLFGENDQSSLTILMAYSMLYGYYIPTIPDNTLWTFQLRVMGTSNISYYHSEYIVGSCSCNSTGGITFDKPMIIYRYTSTYNYPYNPYIQFLLANNKFQIL